MTRSRWIVLGCVCAGILCGVSHLFGQAPEGDSRDREPSLPPKRAHHALAFDATRGEVVLYGGSTAAADESSIFFDDLWSWNGERWLRLASAPIARSSHELIFDPDRKRLLLVGGLSSAGPQRELRVFDGKGWTLLAGEPALAAFEPMVAYDTHRGRLVSLGGKRGGNGGANGAKAGAVETWEFDGKEWQQVATTGPGPLRAGSMVFDEARGVTLLFGGRDDQGKPSDRTWEWDGSAWTRVATSGPPARFVAGLAYDAAREQVVLFGGGGRGGTLGDTWLWDGSDWREADVPGPSGRFMPEMAYDPTRSVTVLFGGRIKYPEDSNETWEWDGERWAQKK
jgi:hypothetical protein